MIRRRLLLSICLLSVLPACSTLSADDRARLDSLPRLEAELSSLRREVSAEGELDRAFREAREEAEKKERDFAELSAAASAFCLEQAKMGNPCENRANSQLPENSP